MWKLHFDVGLYPESQPLFWSRLDRLREASKVVGDLNEAQREDLRSAGVNFFVSLEEILEQALSYSTWALIADHYAETKFAFNVQDARQFMADRLNKRKVEGRVNVQLGGHGRNTLYHLISGFFALSDLCAEMQTNAAQFKRPESQCPGYRGRTSIEIFPFDHTVLFLDLGKEERANVTSLLRAAAEILGSSGVADVRNRIGHKSQDFPSTAEVDAACVGVSDAVSRLEASGLSPLLYRYVGEEQDEYGRKTARFRDSDAREYSLALPSQYKMSGLPSPTQPLVFLKCASIGESGEVLRFTYEEASEYTEMWKDYPKRQERDEPRDNDEVVPDGDGPS